MIRKLIGAVITDIEVNVNGYTIIYCEKDGKAYAIDLIPIVREFEED